MDESKSLLGVRSKLTSSAMKKEGSSRLIDRNQLQNEIKANI